MIVLALILTLSADPADSLRVRRDSVAAPASAPRDTLVVPMAKVSTPPRDSARTSRDSVYTLPVVRVDDARVGRDAQSRVPTAFATELRAGAAGRALESLPELLSEAAGVQVEQYGGLGSFSTVSLRGAAPGQVGVYLDGVPLTSAAHGVINLSDLPVTAVEKVEVYRGLTPSSFGQAGPGGAINLVTGSHPAVSDLRASRGSFGTWEGRVSGGRRVGRLSGSLHAGYQGSAGDFRYDDDNGTPLNAFDDTVSTRVNNRFDAATALGQLTWTPLERVRVVAREDVFRKAQGLAGLGAVPAWTPRLSLVRSLSQLEVTRAGAPARRWVPWLELRGSLDRERTRFRDTGLPDRGELGVGRHATDDRLASDALFGAAGWDGAVPGVALEVDGSLRSERARQQDAADGVPDPPLSRRAARGLGVALQVEPLGRWVLFHVAQRWDRIRDRLAATGAVVPAPEVARSLVTPQLGARVRGPAGFEARTNWTRATRVPDFLELFGNLGSVQGNPGLKPERGESWDAGGSWSGGRGRAHATLEWSHFESRTQELIVYLQNSASSVRARNLSSARVSGEELSLRCTVRDFTLTSASTWMSALNVGAIPAFWTGKRLPLHPARSWTARAQWNGAPLHAGIDVHYLGDNMLDPYNRLRVPSRTLLGASLALTRQFLTLTIEGKNLGDRRVSDVGGFPLPGRSLFVSLEAHAGALPSPSTGD